MVFVAKAYHPCRAQVLIFVVMLMVFIMLIGSMLAFLWEREVLMRKTNEHYAYAFYLAQAALERAKIDVLLNTHAIDSGGWINDFDSDATDAFDVEYQYRIDLVSGHTDQRDLFGEGRIKDHTSGKTLAQRLITVRIDGIADTQVYGIDDDHRAGVVDESWQEI